MMDKLDYEFIESRSDFHTLNTVLTATISAKANQMPKVKLTNEDVIYILERYQRMASEEIELTQVEADLLNKVIKLDTENDVLWLEQAEKRILEHLGVIKPYEPTNLALYLTEKCEGDHKGRVWFEMFDAGLVTDQWLENTHDYIQWWFPLKDPSLAKPFLPYLTDDDVWYMKSHMMTKLVQKQLTDRMKQFYMDNEFWIDTYNHNHLRITRMIKSLRLISGDQAADDFKNWLFDYLGDRISEINGKALRFWRES